ncbi:MAG: DUF4124 domain-containing protein [Candidatus Binatia bacterium]
MKAKNLMFFVLLGGLVLATLQCATAAEVFQWVDSRGVTHFTDDYSRIPASVRAIPDVIVRHSFVEMRQQDPAAAAPVAKEPTIAIEKFDSERRAEELAEQKERYADHASAESRISENVAIIVVNSSPQRKPCHGHACSGRFQPNFNDRRYIHPDVFNGGTRQYIHPNAFTGSSRRHVPPAPGFRRK